MRNAIAFLSSLPLSPKPLCARESLPSLPIFAIADREERKKERKAASRWNFFRPRLTRLTRERSSFFIRGFSSGLDRRFTIRQTEQTDRSARIPREHRANTAPTSLDSDRAIANLLFSRQIDSRETLKDWRTEKKETFDST